MDALNEHLLGLVGEIRRNTMEHYAVIAKRIGFEDRFRVRDPEAPDMTMELIKAAVEKTKTDESLLYSLGAIVANDKTITSLMESVLARA